MTKVTPVTDDEAAAILDTLRTTENISETARRHGRATRTVRRIAAEAGVQVADRTKTAAATQAAKMDNAARRERLKAKLYTAAEEFLDDLHRPHLVHSFGGRDNEYREKVLEKPPTGDIRNLMVSAGIAIQRVTDLERLDGDARVDDARSLLGSLADGLKAAADALPKGTAPDIDQADTDVEGDGDLEQE